MLLNPCRLAVYSSAQPGLASFLTLLLCAAAEGATAVVYAAEDLLTGRPVALKVCKVYGCLSLQQQQLDNPWDNR
jgi:hypothetical protein